MALLAGGGNNLRGCNMATKLINVGFVLGGLTVNEEAENTNVRRLYRVIETKTPYIFPLYVDENGDPVSTEGWFTPEEAKVEIVAVLFGKNKGDVVVILNVVSSNLWEMLHIGCWAMHFDDDLICRKPPNLLDNEIVRVLKTL